jgi:transcriptional regulator with XRE-family HTH domain
MFGEKLKKLRTSKNMTQDEIAALLNVKRQTYSAYERGISMPDANTLVILANYFDVSVDYLLGREEKVYPMSPSQAELLEKYQKLPRKSRRLLMCYVDFLAYRVDNGQDTFEPDEKPSTLEFSHEKRCLTLFEMMNKVANETDSGIINGREKNSV